MLIGLEPASTEGWNVVVEGRPVLHVRPAYAFPSGIQRGWYYYKSAGCRLRIPYVNTAGAPVSENAATTDAILYVQRWLSRGLLT